MGPNPPHVIGDAGLTFPEGDWAALADQLARLQDDPGRRSELSARARARVLSHFTHARIAEETVAVYRQLLSASTATNSFDIS